MLFHDNVTTPCTNGDIIRPYLSHLGQNNLTANINHMLDTALQYQHYWGKKQHSPLKLSRKFTGHRVDSVNASAWNILTWFVWIVCIHSHNLDLFLVFHVFRWGAISLDKQCYGSFLKHIPLPFQSHVHQWQEILQKVTVCRVQRQKYPKQTKEESALQENSIAVRKWPACLKF